MTFQTVFQRYEPKYMLTPLQKEKKQMIDRIRERNGNPEIMVSKQENRTAEL